MLHLLRHVRAWEEEKKEKKKNNQTALNRGTSGVETERGNFYRQRAKSLSRTPNVDVMEKERGVTSDVKTKRGKNSCREKQQAPKETDRQCKH